MDVKGKRTSRIIIGRLKAEDNPKKALKLEENQGYISVLLAVGVKKQQRILKDMPKELKVKTA